MSAGLLLSVAAFANPNSIKADNTATNAKHKHSLTADDQARASDKDVELTRQIRQLLVKDDSLSVYAKNVKIITMNGAVTLKGPVHSELEKNRIAQLAQIIVGSKNISNDLAVVRE